MNHPSEKQKLSSTCETEDRLIQLHIAEFAALTNRNSFLTYIAFTFWPALIVYLTLISNATRLDNAKLMAAFGAFGSFLLAGAWYHCIWEGYNNICYVETVLKPVVRNLVRQEPERVKEVWGYEPWQDPFKGPQWLRTVGDVWPLFLVIAIAIFFFMGNSPKMCAADWRIWALWTANLILSIMIINLAWQTFSVRRSFELGMEAAKRHPIKA